MKYAPKKAEVDKANVGLHYITVGLLLRGLLTRVLAHKSQETRLLLVLIYYSIHSR